MGQLTLILGGARSGKSSYAERLAMERGGRVAYIATAEALDDEMKARITQHKAERPKDWQTLEIPKNIAENLKNHPFDADVILLDCLTLLFNNLMMDYFGENEEIDEEGYRAYGLGEVEELLGLIKTSPAKWLIVSNEVGLGLVSPYPMGRVYRDVLGWANQVIAKAADEVIFMVAGLPMQVK